MSARLISKRSWKGKDGKKRIRYYFDKMIDGERIRIPIKTARTRTDAEEAAIGILKRIHEGTYGKRAGSQLFEDFVREVYLPYARANKRHPQNDEYICETIIAWFKGKAFNKISPLLIEKFKRERKESKTRRDTQRAPASVNRELEILSKIFTLAVDNGLIQANPCRKVKKLRMDNQRTRYLLPDEEKRLLANCIERREYLRSIIILAANTAMRKGDILNLQWKQIDFNQNTILVRNLKAGSGKSFHLPMSELVRETLLSLREESASPYVFINPHTGERYVEIKKAFIAACKDAKITDFRFHDFRHTAATWLVEAGADAYTIAAILGHSTIEMSARYTHASDERKRNFLEAIAIKSEKNCRKIATKERRKAG
jgi:integrase